MSGGIADRIGDGSEGYLLGGMGGNMTALAGRRGGGGIPAINLGWMGIGFDGGMGMSGWG